MTKTNKKIKFALSVSVIFFSTFLNYAYAVQPTDDGPEPPPGVPVDGYIYPMIGIALIIAFVYGYNSIKKTNSLTSNAN